MLCASLLQSYCIQLLHFYFSQFVDFFVVSINDNKLMEYKTYYSWLRGHHAYKGDFEPEIDDTLTLQREPENAKDPFIVAITEERE